MVVALNQFPPLFTLLVQDLFQDLLILFREVVDEAVPFIVALNDPFRF
jgi:hypothetical protein